MRALPFVAGLALAAAASAAGAIPTHEGTVSGRLHLPKDMTVPQSVTVRIESADAPETTIECPVRAGQFVCPVPASRLDLRVAPPGFAPRYFWNIDVTAGATADLGELRFERGGSIAGSVRFDGDGPPVQNVVVGLEPGGLKARPNARGFFQFTHLEPGEYAIITRHDGWSAAREVEIRVAEGRETALARPLIIDPLARVDVLLQPLLDPYGQPWKVALRRLTPLATASTPVAEGSAAMSGSWTADGVDSGVHQVLVSDHRGNVFARSVIDVTSPMAPIAVTISAIAVAGTVTLGDDPLAARLDFRNGHGAAISMGADAEGKFAGALPDEGKWNVDIDTRRGIRLRRSLEVRRRADGPAELELALPDTRVEVTVVDGSGKPAEARVRAFDAEQRPVASGTTDANGRFDFVALEPGEVQLSAKTRASGAESASVSIRVREKDAAEVTLVVRPQLTIKGWLVTPAGTPVAGAFIRWTLPHRGRFYDEEVSGPSGQFQVTLPPDATKLDLVILPPAMPVKLLSLPIRADLDPNLEIVVGGPAGSLEIEMSLSPPFPVIQRGAIAVRTSMLQYPANWTSPPRDLRSWGLSFALEAGQYAVCGDNGANCKSVSLAPGAVERVDARGLLR